LASSCGTDERCQRVRLRGVRSRMASSWPAICCNVQSGDAVLMPTTGGPADPRRPAAGRGPASWPRRCPPRPAAEPCGAVARPSRFMPGFWFNTRTTSPQGWARRIRCTVGTQVSGCARTRSSQVLSGLFCTLRMAAGSRARRSGLPPTRPRLRASPAAWWYRSGRAGCGSTRLSPPAARSPRAEPDHDQRVAGSDAAQQARQHRTRAVSIFLPGFSQPFDVSVKAAAGLSGSTQHAITARHWNPCRFADLDHFPCA
jgi:hypothetical protein